jgi:hypothetical protein
MKLKGLHFADAAEIQKYVNDELYLLIYSMEQSPS